MTNFSGVHIDYGNGQPHYRVNFIPDPRVPPRGGPVTGGSGKLYHERPPLVYNTDVRVEAVSGPDGEVAALRTGLDIDAGEPVYVLLDRHTLRPAGVRVGDLIVQTVPAQTKE